MNLKDGLKPKGRVELFVTKGRPTIIPGELLYDIKGHKVYKSDAINFDDTSLINKSVYENIIFNQGKDKFIQGLTSGFVLVLARMAIGDRGTIPSDPTVSKVPVATMTGLYNEVYRDDIDSTVLNIGTPTIHQVTFTKIFSAVDIPLSSFSNQANPVVNEVAVVMCDLLGGNPLPRPPVAYPATPDADELGFAMRAFKSVPFEAAQSISVTIRYTIFIE